MKKRVLSMLLVLCMVMTLLPATAFAEEVASGVCGAHLTWSLDANGTLTISGTGNMYDYDFSDSTSPWSEKNVSKVILNTGITSIGGEAFKGCDNLTSIVIPDGITSIGDGAFYGCSGMTNVTISNDVTSIGHDAFNGCSSLTDITIPDNVPYIADQMFYNCNKLSNITIHDTARFIGERAFDGCRSLTSITIPNSVTDIYPYAFANCDNLKEISLPNSIHEINVGTFSGCSSLKSIYIPDSVTIIKGNDMSFYPVSGAFENCTSLISVRLPEGLDAIESRTFYNCTALKEISIPNSVTRIGGDRFGNYYGCPDGIFMNCTSLERVMLPSNLAVLPMNAFRNCSSMVNLDFLPNSITEIPSSAFEGCSRLSSIIFPDNLTSIGDAAFRNCSGLENLEIPDSVEHIGSQAFLGCHNLERVLLPNSATSIERYSFEDCEKLTSAGPVGEGYNFEIGWTTEIPAGAFSGCNSLTTVKIPSEIITISSNAFADCGSLSNVIIPESVVNIGDFAFAIDGLSSNGDNIENVYYGGNETQWKAIALGTRNEPLTSATIHYNSTGPDDVGSDNMNPVYFLSGWDAATRKVQFGDEEITPNTYTVADSIDVSNISSLLNKYVLVTMEQGDNSLEYTITDIQSVESKIGTVSATGEHSLTIDGTTYPVREDYILGFDDGKEVLYHVSNGTIMGYNALEEKTGTIEVWNGATGNITIDGTVYSTNYLSDLSFVSNIENYLNKQYYFITVKTGNYTLLYKISERYYPGGKLEDFNADIYHATWLSKHGNAADMLEDKTPSEILIDVVSDGHGDLAMDMWRSLNLVFETLDDVDNLREFAVEPRDLYSALILEALEASASCDVVASEYEEALGIFKRCISDFSTFVKMDTGIDLNNSDEFQDIVSRMPGVDVDAYTEKFIQDWYKTNYPNIADISKSLGYISKGLKVVGTLEDFTEYCAQCITLMRVSDSMKYVLELACLKSAEIYGPTDNMTQAFNDCLQMITRSSDELFDQIEKKAVSVVGWAGYKYLVSEVLWKEVSKQIQIACPEIAILKLIYKAENTICNKLFKTEDAAEKYLKMDGIANIESIINTVYRDLEFAFDRTPTLEGAKRYLSAMELSFRLRNVDCKTSNEYVENIQSSLVGSIKELLGAADYESLKQCINSIQSEYATHYTLAETGWVPYLEEDYPGSGLYELYSALYETILDSGADVKLIKQITAACPVNVYIYDQQDNIVASIVESRVSCSVNDVMIALLGEEKIIRFYNGADYHIEYVGYDIGEMDVTITEFDENEKTTRTVNYYDLKLTEGKTYAVDANNETLKPYDLLDKSNNSTVQHDYDSMDTNNSHTLKIISGTLQQGGELFTETIASKGETLQIDAYVSEGDEFVRWEASSVNALIADTTSTNTTLIMPDEDLIVTAIMRETSSPSTLHTVTFNPNGGTVDVSIAVTASNGKLSTLPIPILAGHAFDGWYTASSGGEKITTDYVFTSDTTVYAHWTKNSGGSSGGSSSDGNSSGGGSSSASYSITTGNFAHGSVSVSPKSASKGTKVTITATPDTGYKLEKLAVTDNTGNELELTNKGDGTYTFIMPAGTVKVEASFVAIETAEAPWVNPFTDVAENAWYYNAVRFVSENGLMGGYGNGLFGVNDNLSRAQLAQILYNKEGKPLVNDGNGFSDVDTGAWYANAVTWAVANGIVSGYGNGMFGPNNPITREQLAVMLWRYSGSPAATNKELHFNDAEEISGYALEALRWAVENGILNGYGDGRLGPQGQATRAQVAQMLKNYLER